MSYLSYLTGRVPPQGAATGIKDRLFRGDGVHHLGIEQQVGA
ncbi:MAG: hypothetical protein NWQ11_09700 [Pseudomonadales bacterium]|nr:hypothetical protein [Pseudomonadales bacterium]